MGYANPIERYGIERFADAARDAGVDGVLVVDYPPEECADFAALLKARAIDPIFLIAPTSTDERIAGVARVASGYVYHVSLKGVTGRRATSTSAAVAAMMPRIKAQVKLPVGVGFGIRDAKTARAVAEVADAVVIGSALIQHLEGAGGRKRRQWRDDSSPRSAPPSTPEVMKERIR
jgi:tryptophan synthase alpha chain